MAKFLFLASEDLGESWTRERFQVVDTMHAEPTGQSLISVKFDSDIASEIAGVEMGKRLYLGATPSPNTVDIYLGEDLSGKRSISITSLQRIGTGTISS